MNEPNYFYTKMSGGREMTPTPEPSKRKFACDCGFLPETHCFRCDGPIPEPSKEALKVTDRHYKAVEEITKLLYGQTVYHNSLAELLARHFPATPPAPSVEPGEMASDDYAEEVFERYTQAVVGMVIEIVGPCDIDSSPGETERETRGSIIGQCKQKLEEHIRAAIDKTLTQREICQIVSQEEHQIKTITKTNAT